jgi:hypothetical protein
MAQAVTGLSARKPGLNARPVHVGFVVDKVAVGQGLLRVHQFSPASIIPPVLLAHAFIYQRHYISQQPTAALHYKSR